VLEQLAGALRADIAEFLRAAETGREAARDPADRPEAAAGRRDSAG